MADEQPPQSANHTEPSDQRQAELEALHFSGLEKDKSSPYKGVRIETLGELEWILHQRGWSGGSTLPVGMQANLSGADFHGTNLIGVNLHEANLTGADLFKSNLAGADLSLANLSGAYLGSANLSGATLARALMSAETILDYIIIDASTSVLGVRWNGVPLDRIKWPEASLLGDEPTRKAPSKGMPRDRAEAYRDAARAYHGLVVALRNQGLNEAASRYRLREFAMQRQVLRSEHRFGAWSLNVLLGAVAGHGEKPGRVFGIYLGIVTIFAAIYWMVTNVLHSGAQPLQWYEAAVLSLSAFHGRGFFPSTINLGDPLAIVAALEAVSGLFVELIFISTFSRRFLDS